MTETITRAWCRSCAGEIVWSLTPRGKAAPIDLEPSERGGILLVAVGSSHTPISVVLTGNALTLAQESGRPLRTSHFATCPNADRHRKR